MFNDSKKQCWIHEANFYNLDTLPLTQPKLIETERTDTNKENHPFNIHPLFTYWKQIPHTVYATKHK